MRIAFVLVLLLALVGIAVITSSSEVSPPGQTVPQSDRDSNAEKPSQPDTTAQLALDGAIAGALLSTFDDTDARRRRARKQTLDQLVSIRKNTAKELVPQGQRSAERFMRFSFVPRLGWASARDYVDDQRRVANLFDEALGAETGKTLLRTNTALVDQQSRHFQQLERDQQKYWSSFKSRGAPPPPRIPTPASVSVLKEADIKGRLLTRMANSLKARFPKILADASRKAGEKTVKRAPTALLDGPAPIVETALILWGIYDLGDGVMGLRKLAAHNMSSSLSNEADSIVEDQQRRVSKDIVTTESKARNTRCQILRQGLTGLRFPASSREFGRRCS